MTQEELRQQFPALSRQVYGRQIVYFDNAATAQRPRPVIDKWVEVSERHNANIHRAGHLLSIEATNEFEAAREAVRDFIHAQRREEIVFTSGATASINLVAFSFGEAFVKPGDEIVVSEAEHHSDIVPWQMLCDRKGAVLKVLPVAEDGRLRVADLDRLCSPRTKMVAVSHVSNVLGLVNPVREIVHICHARQIPVLVDGAQGIVHEKVDVQEIDCDFYAFSGHKMYGAPGTGVLYGKRKWLEALPPYMGGGEMVKEVRFSGTTYASIPWKFEAGTQNIAGVPAFVPAIDLVKSLRESPLRESGEKVKAFLLQALLSDDRIRLFGAAEGADRIPLFSFVVKGVHHEDLALVLDKMGVAVRSGQMCAEPLMDRYGVTGMLRASLAPYNTMEEAEYFVEALDRAIKMLK